MLFGYARVSTADQNPQLQLDALTAAKCNRIFTDQAASGRTMNRPELIKCLDTVREGDTLVIWKLDRLGRSVKDLLEIVERLRGQSVQLRSLTENIDTGSASGELIFHIFAVLAQFERTRLRERTMAGLASARARGRFGGGRRKTTPQQDKQMRSLWDSGNFTGGEIAKQFGISAPTFWRRVEAWGLTKPKTRSTGRET